MAVGLVGTVLLLTGCTSTQGPQKKTSAPFGKSSSADSLRKQSGANSFPTAQQVGL
jgi:hypothetical protein